MTTAITTMLFILMGLQAQTAIATTTPEIIVEELTVEEKIAQYDWPIEDVHKLIECESNWNIKAIGDTTTSYSSYGLMQIRGLPGRPSPETLMTVDGNLDYAYKIYLEQGRRFGTTGGWYNCANIMGVY